VFEEHHPQVRLDRDRRPAQHRREMPAVGLDEHRVVGPGAYTPAATVTTRVLVTVADSGTTGPLERGRSSRVAPDYQRSVFSSPDTPSMIWTWPPNAELRGIAWRTEPGGVEPVGAVGCRYRNFFLGLISSLWSAGLWTVSRHGWDVS